METNSFKYESGVGMTEIELKLIELAERTTTLFEFKIEQQVIPDLIVRINSYYIDTIRMDEMRISRSLAIAQHEEHLLDYKLYLYDTYISKISLECYNKIIEIKNLSESKEEEKLKNEMLNTFMKL